MRIIDPRDFKPAKPPKHARKLVPRKFWAGVVFIVGLFLILRFVNLPRVNIGNNPSGPQQSQNPTAQINASSPPEQLKNFSADEFKNLADNFDYPNTQSVASPPTITDNTEADLKIRAQAEALGYHLVRPANLPLDKTEGFPLQNKAIIGWQELKTAALKEGQALNITSAFRSIEEQRLFFLQRLSSIGLTSLSIAGAGDNSELKTILMTTTIPGYSRHHSGYTVSLSCNDQEPVLFGKSPCHEWLKKNNYENAKKYGWIPGYPEGLNTGALADTSEYIYVGRDSLIQK